METTNLKLNVTNLKSIFPSGNGSSSIMGKSGSRFIPRPSGRGGTIIPPEGIKRRKRRIDAKKQAIREERARKQKQMREIAEIIKYGGIGIVSIAFIGLVIYIMMILAKPANAIEVWGQEKSEPFDECHDFKVDVMICMNEGAEATYARYGREYKGTLPRSDMYTMCRLKKSEWFEKDMNKRANDPSYKCTYQHPQGLPDIQLTTGPRFNCPRNIECKVRK